MRVEENWIFLKDLVTASAKQRRKLLLGATKEQLKTLIECILNFDSVTLKEEDQRLFDKSYKNLLLFNYQDLGKTRRYLLKHTVELIDLVNIVRSLFLYNGSNI